MLKNYFKIALRNLIKNKSHTLINIGGLTLGIICSVIIFLIIQFDLSFDTWHKDSDKTYRVVRHETEFGKSEYNRGGPYPLAEAIRNDIVGVESAILINDNFSIEPILSYYEKGELKQRIKEDDIAFADKDFFDLFTYEWLAGDPETAIEKPNTAVITVDLATKLFGTTDVVGKFLEFNGGSESDIEITGLVKNPPKNTDFPFKFIGALRTQDRLGQTAENPEWGSNSSGTQTYVKLEPGTSAAQVNAQFDGLIAKYRSEERSTVMDFFLQPLSEIHFDSRFDTYNNRVIEKRILFALGLIGLFLLITACINFINLNTAIAISRSKEVGLRKTLGGTKGQLLLHFLGETAFVTLVSMVLGIALSEIILLQIEPLLGFSPEMALLSNIELQLFLLIIFAFITLIAGWYPAQHLSNFSPTEALKNKINSSYGKGITLRRSLIVVQFTITQVLIICTMVIASQISYFQNQDLGYKGDALVEVPIPNDSRANLNQFKNSLLTQFSIEKVTFSNTGTTSNSVWGGNYILTDDSIRHENDGQVKFIDEDFLNTYGITLLAGSNVTPSDTVRSYLINETLAKQVGYGDNLNGLIGKNISMWGTQAPIIGVVKDFNTQSLHQKLEPVLLTTRKTYYIAAIKVNTSDTPLALAEVERAFTSSFPNLIFEYNFLDDQISKMYEEEQRTAKIMNAFTLIAILIGSLGLFGLVSYMATTRTKEIGVRKVLGASILDILKIFGFELAILTGISFVIAAPLSWYLMQNWLSEFAYKIDLGIEIFGLAFLGTILIALLTVGYKSISAALTDPVKSLKSE